MSSWYEVIHMNKLQCSSCLCLANLEHRRALCKCDTPWRVAITEVGFEWLVDDSFRPSWFFLLGDNNFIMHFRLYNFAERLHSYTATLHTAWKAILKWHNRGILNGRFMARILALTHILCELCFVYRHTTEKQTMDLSLYVKFRWNSSNVTET